MEPMNNRRYPIGIQTFSKIREEGCIYIDKTEHIYKLTHSSSNYVFLAFWQITAYQYAEILF